MSFPGRRPVRNSKGEIIGASGASGCTVENDCAVAEVDARAVSEPAAGAGVS